MRRSEREEKLLKDIKDTDGIKKIADAIDITRVVTVSKYLAPTNLSATSATIWTPATGKKIRLKRLQLSSDSTTRLDVRWGTTAFESFYVPGNGSVVITFVGANEEGAVDTALTVYSTLWANVTAHASGDEV